MSLEQASNQDVLEFLAGRLRAARLNENVTQADLAEAAGVSLMTVKRAESGKANTTLLTFVALLRALGRVDQLELLLPGPAVRPMELAASGGQRRQRASGQRSEPEHDEPDDWIWGDERP